MSSIQTSGLLPQDPHRDLPRRGVKEREEKTEPPNMLGGAGDGPWTRADGQLQRGPRQATQTGNLSGVCECIRAAELNVYVSIIKGKGKDLGERHPRKPQESHKT